MAFGYPVMLELRGRRCVVIGGGGVGEHKARGLLAAGADVTVVTDNPSAGLEELERRGAVSLTRRSYAPGDLAGAFLAIAATDDPAVNAEILREAEERRVLLNAVDDIERCHFAAPSIVRRGDLTISISTGGKAPALAKRLRRRLSAEFGSEWGVLVELLGRVREEALPSRQVSFEVWAERWQHALDHDLLRMVQAGELERAGELVRRCLEGEGERRGRVAIVGAGPGDPQLITLRGKQLLESADVVVHDRLVHADLIRGKEAISVGKEPGKHSPSQEDINMLLVNLAVSGKRVVRLKGGDPFVFGRGAEEAEALAGAGIPFEVVPAPSSAVAAAGAAGIPVTDRRHASSLAVVTGHCVTGEVDWEGLARSVDTLVVLMGLGRLREIAERLVAAGMSPSTPAAVIERATLPEQRVIVSPLRALADRVAEARVRSPATIVIGEVVRLRQAISSVDLPPQESGSESTSALR
ncbi:MAG: siroheme synthase CysG [Actinomycetota bacterium]